MTKDAKSHAHNRKIHCAACGIKSPKCVPVTESISQLIREEVYACYSADDISFPGGICGNCRKNLFLAKKGEVVPVEVRERWKSLDYSKFRPPTRNGPCTTCTMCNAGRYKFAQVYKTSQGMFRYTVHFSDLLPSFTFIYRSKSKSIHASTDSSFH